MGKSCSNSSSIEQPRSRVSDFVEQWCRLGAFLGTKSYDAFFVQCDRTRRWLASAVLRRYSMKRERTCVRESKSRRVARSLCERGGHLPVVVPQGVSQSRHHGDE